MKKILVLMMFAISVQFANELDTNFISLEAQEDTNQTLNIINSDILFKELKSRYSFNIKLTQKDDKSFIVLKDFSDDSVMNIVHDILQEKFSDIPIKYTKDKNSNSNKDSDFITRIIFASLAFFMVFVGFIFIGKLAKKNKKLEEEYDKLDDKLSEMSGVKHLIEKEHEKLLNNLGYKIETSAQKMIKERDKIMEQPLDSLTQESIDEKFKSIKKTDKILTETTNQVVDFLKAKSGKLKLNKEKFDITKLLWHITSSVSKMHQDKDNVEIVYDLDTTIPRYIECDRERLTNILINLVENGVKYTQRGKIKVNIEIIDEKIHFSIIDNGVGIKDDKLEAIFTPFQNIGLLSDKHTIGLFMSRELIKLMGGSLTIKSVVNKGTKVVVTIPLKAEIDTNNISYSLSNSDTDTEGKSLLDKNIAIVDKDVDTAYSIRKMASQFSRNVDIIQNNNIKNYETLLRYDFLYIEHSMLDEVTKKLIGQIKGQKDFKVVVMYNILNKKYKELKDDIIEKNIAKPLTPYYMKNIFVEVYSQLKIVKNIDEILVDKKDEEDKEDNNLEKYNNSLELQEAQNITKDSLREFYGATILIVEENKITQKILMGLFKDTGIKYVIANNLNETMAQLKKYYNNFDLILVDISIINTEGLVLSKMIRLDKSFNKLPIVAITDKVDSNLQNYGINSYIMKPIKIGTIYAMFDRFLSKIDLEKDSLLLSLSKSEHILDITRGIMQSNNNYLAYIEVLKGFRDAYGESSEMFEKLIEAKEYEQAKELIIDVKGLAQIIAAHDLYNILLEIEKLFISHNYNQIERYISRYEDELDKLNINTEIYLRSIK